MIPDASAGRTSTTSPAGQNSPSRGHLYALPVSHVPDEKSSASSDRVPPHDVDLERDLLAVAILHGDYPMAEGSTVLAEIVGTGLQPDHLYVPAHRRVWAAILELHEAGLPIDVHTVVARSHDRNDVLGLVQVPRGTVRTPAPVWARLVIDYADCRALLPFVEATLDELVAGRLAEVRVLLERIRGEVAA